MNKNINKIQIITLIFLVFMFICQIFFIYKGNKEKNHREVFCDLGNNEDISLDYVCNKIEVLQGKQVINAEKDNNGWRINLRLKGDEKDLLEEIGKLKGFFITDFEMTKNNDGSCIDLEILFQNRKDEKN